MRQLDNLHFDSPRRLAAIKAAFLQLRPLAFLLLAGALFLGGCGNDDAPAGPIPVSLRAAIATATPAATDAASNATTDSAGGKLNTRTAPVLPDGTAWEDDDRIGLFMLPEGEGDPDEAYPDAMNKQYRITDDATGALAPVDNVPLYFPKGEEVNFIAYYPFKEGQTKYIELDFGYQEDPAALDILYARVTGITPTKAPVGLEFRHVLSRITLNITAGNGITVDDIEAMVSNDVTTTINQKGLIELSDGMYIKQGDALISNIAFYRHTSHATGTHATFSAIVPPTHMTNTPDYHLTLLVGGQAYRCTLSLGENQYYYPGKNYIFPVTVNRSEATVAPPTIGEWDVVEAGATTASVLQTVFIPAGTFMMGSPNTEQGRYRDETQHQVTLTQSFRMTRYEITIAQYAEFLNDKKVPGEADGNEVQYTLPDGSQHPLFKVNGEGWTPVWNASTRRWKVLLGKENYPMGYVSWHGAKLYAEWAGGALPTEAQWEYACRAGTTTAYSFGDNVDALGEYAVYEDNEPGEYPSPVGSKKPNPWGLYDMHGNVGEWWRDSWNNAPYDLDPVTDPLSPNPGDWYVARGGSYYFDASFCRSAFRSREYPKTTSFYIGFRIIYPE